MQPELIAGRYRQLRAVGRGGMGTVWLCHDVVLNREVAAKQIEGLPGESAAEAARPLREARLAAAVSHSNAVSLYDIVEDDGSTWLVMEYVPSVTLAELLLTEGRLPVERVISIGAQVASALDAAHALGIVHRDIKPGNVLIGDGDRAKISDFGIARGQHDEQLTLTGFVTGTPSYFSPELARGGDPSPASDVWALGATLYAAVEGEPPYGRDANPLALLARIASEPPPRPAHAGPLTGTLRSMLTPRVEDRASMHDVVTSLRRLDGSGETETTRVQASPAAVLPPGSPVATPPVGTLVSDERVAVRRRGIPSPALLAVGLATVLVLLMGVAVVWAMDRSPDDSTASGPDAKDRTPQSSTQQTHESSPSTPTNSTPTRSTPTQSTPTQSTPSSTPPSPPTQKPPPPPSGTGPAAFVSAYYRVVPGDLEAGWKLLAPSMRKVGHSSYENFWGSMDSVEVAGVHAVSATSVDYQITYHFSGGRVVQEEKRIDLEPHAHSYRITSDTTLHSTTLHP